MMEESGAASGLGQGDSSPLDYENNCRGAVKPRSASLAAAAKIKAKARVHKRASKAQEKAAQGLRQVVQ